jgi:hypothetical protein
MKAAKVPRPASVSVLDGDRRYSVKFEGVKHPYLYEVNVRGSLEGLERHSMRLYNESDK